MEFQKNVQILFFACLLSLGLATTSNSQVALRPIAEHFTNTKCSICASKNPALYANLNTNPSVMHLSIHPSSPYSSCILSQQNTADNDARTNFYNVYGGTPRLVINGVVFTGGSNFGTPTLFNAYLGLTTPFDVEVQQVKYGEDSIRTRVVVRTEAQHSLTEARLFVGLVEDTVFVNGGNGEDEHYNVLRNALTAPQGMVIGLPTVPGDSTVFSFTAPANAVWDFSRMYSIAILQNADTKAVLQTGKTDTSSGSVVSSVGDVTDALQVAIYPNPAQGMLHVELPGPDDFNIELYAPQGGLLYRKFQQHTANIDVSELPGGLYYIRVSSGNKSITKKVFVQH